MSSKDIFNAIKQIENLKSISYEIPESYNELFVKWSLLNKFYNASYPSESKEWKKVTQFGKDKSEFFDLLYDKNLNDIIALIQECIGKGRYGSLPDKYVKRASIKLKEMLDLDLDCPNCRGFKKHDCHEILEIPEDFDPFEALMRIIYQVRCNLFHGDKFEFRDRDRRIVEACNSLLGNIIKQIV